MSANARWKRLWWLAAMFVAAVLAVVLVVSFKGSAGSAPGDAEDMAARGQGAPSWPRNDRVSRSSGSAVADHEPAVAGSEEAAPPDMGENEYPVDLEHLRSRIPYNLYWRLGEPTLDPETLKARAEEEQRWNDLFGKVQSSTATEDEVHRYYEHRRKLSHDYIEFARLVLETYADRLPERDRGMYELSIEMHTARLAEIPRLIEDALARRSAYEQRKKEWLESQGK